MHKLIKKCLILGLIIFMMSVLGFMIAWVVTYIKVERSNALNLSEVRFNNEAESKFSIFDTGSSVDIHLLEKYFLFSHQKEDFLTWKNKLIENNVIIVKDHKVYFKEDTKVSGLISNTCNLNHCFQHRVAFSKIPLGVINTLIGIEDVRYLKHSGIDFKSILRALIVDIKEMKLVQGGSTITQQLVKNLFLSNEKTISRKFKEAIYSIYLEGRYSKETILSAYLNEVYWGSSGGLKIKGAYAASLFYFGKKLEHLSTYESAILISMLQGPNLYNPKRLRDRFVRRVETLFEKLKEQKLINEDEKSFTKNDWKNWSQEYLKRLKLLDYKVLAEINYIKTKNIDDFSKFVFLKSVQHIKSLYSNQLKEKDFAIKTYIKTLGCTDNCKVIKYYSKEERSLEKSLSEESHSVGSVLKPIIYEQLIELGLDDKELISTKPIRLKLKSGQWEPKDYSPAKKEFIDLKETLLRSRNIPIIKAASKVGFDELEKKLLFYIPRLKKPLGEYPSQLIGGVELTINEVYTMYESFIFKQCEKYGKIEESESSLNLLSRPTETTIKNLISKQFRKFRFFGKTGTSNNGIDSWFVFYDGRDLGVIWAGIESNKNKEKLKMTGASGPFRLMQHYYLSRGKGLAEFQCPNVSD